MLYLAVGAAKLLIVLSLHGYIADNKAWSDGLQATYATLAYPGFAFATSIIVISALLGRAEFVRFFMGGEFWTMWRSLAFGMSMYAPINAMVYLLGLSVTQHIDYQMVFYVFCSTFIFTMIFMMYYFTFVDRPFHSLFLFYHDLKTVT